METYKNLCTQYYELDKPHAPEDAFAFYLQYAEEANGPILEPMCGTGRFLIPLLERGFEVDSSDSSEYMLAICKEKCALKGLTPKLYHEYLHETSHNKKYALIFIPSGSFGLITKITQARACLKILCDHLQPKGKLIFEIETVQAAQKALNRGQGQVMRGDGAKITISTLPTYDEKTQILQIQCRYDLIRDNEVIETEIEDIKQRCYQNHEMDSWLKEAGFEKISQFTAYNRESTDRDADIIIYECVK